MNRFLFFEISDILIHPTLRNFLKLNSFFTKDFDFLNKIFLLQDLGSFLKK